MTVPRHAPSASCVELESVSRFSAAEALPVLTKPNADDALECAAHHVDASEQQRVDRVKRRVGVSK
jgi:hypothetical protein